MRPQVSYIQSVRYWVISFSRSRRS